jgi:acetyl esterase/lipase
VESKGLVVTEQMDDRGRSGAPDRRYRNITTPHLEIFRAPHPNGCGVVILPGGGYSYVVIDKEGRDVARWFNSIGINAFVLKYRLPNTTAHRFGPEIPLRDAQHAMRLVRRRAAEFGVQPDRLGVIGFSAGGHLASTLATHFDAGQPDAAAPVDRASCRPDFLILGYPVISMDEAVTHAGSRTELLGKHPGADLIQRFSNELQVTSNTPPVFLVAATDDKAVKVDNSLRFYAAARAAGVPVELHIFERGGHGFGIRTNNRAGAAWPALCASWLRARGFLDNPSSSMAK